MGWLSGWAKRFKVTVDSGLIDASLTDYPLPIFLGASCGTTLFDAKDIFLDLNPQDNVTISDLVAWYKGDLDGATFRDWAGSYNLTPSGPGASSQDGLWGKVLDFDQTAGASSTSAPTLGTTFSISWWFRNVGGTTIRRMILVGNLTPNYNALTVSLNSGGAIQLYNKGYSTVAADNPYIYGDSLWHNVVVVSNNRAITIYVDGAAVYSGTPFAQMYIQNGVITLGGTTYRGQIADCRIFSRALSADEARSLFYGGARKIAVTDAGGTTELPAEIASWNPGDMRGVIYAKVPHVSSSQDTDVFVYYDPAKGENANVGFPGSAAAQAVWDENYISVHHVFAHDAIAGGSWMDSTANQINGTHVNLERNDYRPSYGSPSGRGLNRLRMDGTNEGIGLGANPAFDFTASVTLEVYCNPEFPPITNQAVIQKDLSSASPSWSLQRDGTNNRWRFSVNVDDTLRSAVSPNDWVLTVDQYLAGTYDGSSARLYLNGLLEASEDCPGSIYGVPGKSVFLGKSRFATSENFRGDCCEFRVSNTARSAAWIKATAKGLFDELVSIAASTPPSYTEVSADKLGLGLVLNGAYGGPREILYKASVLSSWIALLGHGVEIGQAKEIDAGLPQQIRFAPNNPAIDLPVEVAAESMMAASLLLEAEVKTEPYPQALLVVRTSRVVLACAAIRPRLLSSAAKPRVLAAAGA